MTAGYYRNWYGNFLVTDNTLVDARRLQPFCITAPKDARLPDGGGYQVCGLDDISPGEVRAGEQPRDAGVEFGEQKQVNDFFNVTFNTRFARGMLLGGGVDTGRTVTDNCFVVDSPQQLLNCRQSTAAQGQHAGQGVRQLPSAGRFRRERQSSRTSRGPPITASYAASNAEIAPSLGATWRRAARASPARPPPPCR